LAKNRAARRFLRPDNVRLKEASIYLEYLATQALRFKGLTLLQRFMAIALFFFITIIIIFF
jgi:hypothetical protein